MLPYRIEPVDRPWLAILAGLAATHALLLDGFGWLVAGGNFVLGSDAAYLNLRYAEMLARGVVLRLHPDSVASAAVDHPLWMVILVPLFWAKLHGAAASAAALSAAILAWVLVPLWVYQLVSRLSNCLAGAIAAGLLVANAGLVSQVLAADGGALFSALLVGAVLAAQAWWQEEDRRARWVMVALAMLLPVAGPTGILFPLFVVVIGLLRRGDRHGPPIVWLLLSFVPFVLWRALVAKATGDWRPSGSVVDSWISRGDLAWSERLLLGAGAVRAVADLLTRELWAVTALAAFGAFFVLASEWRSQRLSGGTLLAALWLAGLVMECARMGTEEARLGRLLPTMVLGFVLAGVSLRRLAQLFQQHEDTALKAMGGALLLATLSEAPAQWSRQARAVAEQFALDRRATILLAGGQGPVLTDAPGMVAFLTNRPVLDFKGRVVPGLQRAAHAGAGAFAEALAAQPEALRPTVMAARGVDEGAIPGAGGGDVELLSPDAARSFAIIPLDPKAAAEAAPIIAPAERLLMEVNVAALPSEAGAAYAFTAAAVRGDGELAGTQCLDGATGRWVREESFRFAPTARPGRGVVLRGRVMLAVRQEVNGAAAEADALTSVTMELKPSAGSDSETTQSLSAPAAAAAAAPTAEVVEPPKMSNLVLRVTSEATGFSVERALPEPSEGMVEAPLGELLEAAGGASWRVAIMAPNEPDAVWFSARWWVVE